MKGFQIGFAYKNNLKLQWSNLYELYSINNNKVELDTTALKVLCLGNSITYHAPKKGDLPGADSLWRGNWGMCASRPEYDYVHQLELKLRQFNPQTTVSTKNLWEWEHNFDIDKDSLLSGVCDGKDLIIIKIGENVNAANDKNFKEAFEGLVSYCRGRCPNVIIVGIYWPRPQMDHYMIQVAREYHLPFVPISWIFSSYTDDVIAHVGDTIYDAQMKPYLIATNFICTHPNDKGMSMIAEAIYNSITFKNEHN